MWGPLCGGGGADPAGQSDGAGSERGRASGQTCDLVPWGLWGLLSLSCCFWEAGKLLRLRLSVGTSLRC